MDSHVPTIVVIAYNRLHSLRRLLTSLEQADFSSWESVNLFVSIDGGGPTDVVDLANQFQWPHGKKHVRRHKEQLGLRRHVMACGDLTDEFGSIIILEDDLFVSPHFFHYATQALDFYANDSSICGISLYNMRFHEGAIRPFEAFDDGNDVYFIQLPSSWGQAWTTSQWREFRDWYSARAHLGLERLPGHIRQWPETSWKKYFTLFLIETDRYFVYPRMSLTTNFGDEGTHMHGTRIFQVPLAAATRDYRFARLDDSYAVYDSHMEPCADVLTRVNAELRDYTFDVDLYGVKERHHFVHPYVLTVRPTSNTITGFSRVLKPHEAGVFFNQHGSEIRLARTQEIFDIESTKTHISNACYDYPYINIRTSLNIFRSQMIPKLSRKVRNALWKPSRRDE